MAMETMTGQGEEALPLEDAELSLDIGGMTCASCVARVERSLKRVPGTASESEDDQVVPETVRSDV